jgi:low temperature requirement protein LtrA
MYWRAYRHVSETRHLVQGYLVGFGLAAVVWSMSAIMSEDTRIALWAVALSIDLATPWVMRRQQAQVPLDVSHLPERFGLFTILVLGESIAAVVAGVADHMWSASHVVTAAVGIGIATALWWMYFDNASGTVVRRSAEIRRTWRPTAWIYTHLPLAAGVAALGVGLEVSVSAAGAGPMPSTERWLLVGSAAVVLGAMALIQFASISVPGSPVNRAITINRLAGIPFLILIGLFSPLEAQWVALGVLGVCVAEVVADLTATEEVGPVQAPGEFEAPDGSQR